MNTIFIVVAIVATCLWLLHNYFHYVEPIRKVMGVPIKTTATKIPICENEYKIGVEAIYYPYKKPIAIKRILQRLFLGRFGGRYFTDHQGIYKSEKKEEVFLKEDGVTTRTIERTYEWETTSKKFLAICVPTTKQVSYQY